MLLKGSSEKKLSELMRKTCSEKKMKNNQSGVWAGSTASLSHGSRAVRQLVISYVKLRRGLGLSSKALCLLYWVYSKHCT